MSLFCRILPALLFPVISAFAVDEFPPVGFKVALSENSPGGGFKIIHFARDLNQASEAQIWIEPVLQPGKARFMRQLLFAHNNRVSWLISADENFIALNNYAKSTDGLLHVFSLGSDALFHKVKMDFRDAAQQLLISKLKVKKRDSDFDHEYCYADCWLRDGCLIGHLEGHDSSTMNGLHPWYFIYDVKNDLFFWDLSRINKNAVEPAKDEKKGE